MKFFTFSAWVVLQTTVLVAADYPILLDPREQWERHDFRANLDFDWFQQNVPRIDSPDKDLDLTYYYRWELVTRHRVYGDPNTGYVFTEFADRPFWSGAYGTISCPAGMQIDEVRWLADPRYARDFMRFWMRHPGAQPRKYSFWAAESAWSIHEVAPSKDFIVDLFPDLVRNFEGWMERGWVEEMGLFWQLGHDDGMEFDINAQQTNDALRGGESLRPSFNSYMWADAKSLSSIAGLAGDDASAKRFEAKAARIKASLQDKLWDPSRAFFFPMSNQRHEKNGHVVEKHALTYETGEFAGSPHGRELHGYVPWAFNLPDAGFEEAWQFLDDENFFKAPFGPTTVERNDPLFVLKESCCWWSGQSWPFATAQTLKAMANLLQNYRQDHVDRQAYAALLHTFAVSHRKDGKPYVAEALNPFNGSWKGHDMPNRSEHYFHSGFVDLVITGLAGLQPNTSDTVTIKPLIPPSWDYFAMDAIPYHGHMISIVWDRDGKRYGQGPGLQLRVNGKTVARSEKLGKLEARLPGGSRSIPIDPNPPMNFAVNNDGSYFPRYTASFVGPEGGLAMIGNGVSRYDRQPLDRWTSEGSGNDEDWVAVDFGVPRTISTMELCLIDDGEDMTVRAPHQVRLETWDGAVWQPVKGGQAEPPEGGRPLRLDVGEVVTSRIRAVFRHVPGKASAISEIMAWGPGERPYSPPAPPEGNLAFNREPEAGGFPKIRASFSDQYGGVPEKAVDGRIVFASSPSNRWTSYGSPNTESDWLELEFEKEETVGRVVLYIFDDAGGVVAPRAVKVQTLKTGVWTPVEDMEQDPVRPIGGMANQIRFSPVKTDKVRIVLEHVGRRDARSGVTEIEVWAE